MNMLIKNPMLKILLLSLVYSVASLASDNGSYDPNGKKTSTSVVIANFTIESLDEWERKSFVGETKYSIESEDNRKVLKAVSQSSASGMAKEKKIDLLKTPYLNWSWKISNKLTNLDETKKSGDDYAARVYVVKDGGWKIWNTRALNYVWSSNQPKGSQWDNAFVGDKAKMLALQGLNDSIGEWVTEKRNVYQDLIDTFGDKGSAKKNEEAYRYIDAVALMTDTDNSQTDAIAYYGNIFFTSN